MKKDIDLIQFGDSGDNSSVDAEIYVEGQRDDLRILLNQEQFVSFVHDLLDRCGVLTQCDRSDGKLPIRTGEQNIGNWVIQKLLDYAPGKLESVLKYQSSQSKKARNLD